MKQCNGAKEQARLEAVAKAEQQTREAWEAKQKAERLQKDIEVVQHTACVCKHAACCQDISWYIQCISGKHYHMRQSVS